MLLDRLLGAASEGVVCCFCICNCRMGWFCALMAGVYTIPNSELVVCRHRLAHDYCLLVSPLWSSSLFFLSISIPLSPPTPPSSPSISHCHSPFGYFPSLSFPSPSPPPISPPSPPPSIQCSRVFQLHPVLPNELMVCQVLSFTSLAPLLS